MAYIYVDPTAAGDAQAIIVNGACYSYAGESTTISPNVTSIEQACDSCPGCPCGSVCYFGWEVIYDCTAGTLVGCPDDGCCLPDCGAYSELCPDQRTTGAGCIDPDLPDHIYNSWYFAGSMSGSDPENPWAPHAVCFLYCDTMTDVYCESVEYCNETIACISPPNITNAAAAALCGDCSGG